MAPPGPGAGKPAPRKRRRSSRARKERGQAAPAASPAPAAPEDSGAPTGEAARADTEAVADAAEAAAPEAEPTPAPAEAATAEAATAEAAPAPDHGEAPATEAGPAPAEAAAEDVEPSEPAPVAAAPAPALLTVPVPDGSAPGRLHELAWDTGLLNVATLARTELASIFRSPLSYAITAVVIILTSIFGYLPQVNGGEPVSMAGVFGWLALLMGFFTPLCTARSLAGEHRSGQLEHLLTSPIRFWELVAGKWLGGFLFYVVAVSFTLIYVALISADRQAHIDYGSVFTGYLGVLLVGAAWVALGLLASSLTRSQIVAAAVGVAMLIALQLGLGTLAGYLTPPFSDLFDYLAASSRAQSFNQGQIVLRDLAYFLTLSVGALFVTTRIVESRKWR